MNERAAESVGIVVERCPSCSAHVASPRAERCSYCGALFKRDPATAGAAPHASPDAERAQRLARVRTSRVFSECLVTNPSESVFYTRLAARFGPLPVALLFITFVTSHRGAPRWLAPLAVATAAAVAIAAFARIVRFRSAPLVCRPACVADERKSVERRGRRTTTRYFATLAFETGACQEYEVQAALAAELVTGRAGVAFERDGVLLHFRRVEV